MNENDLYNRAAAMDSGRREALLLAEVERLRSLLREAYDGRQKPMKVGLCYRIGSTLNHAELGPP